MTESWKDYSRELYSRKLEREITLMLNDPTDSMSYGICAYILSVSTSNQTLQIPTHEIYSILFRVILNSKSSIIVTNIFSLLLQLHRIHPLHATPELWRPSLASLASRIPTTLQLFEEISTALQRHSFAGPGVPSSPIKSSPSSSQSSSSSSSSSPLSQNESIAQLEEYLTPRLLLVQYYLTLFEDELTHVYSPKDYQDFEQSELWKCFADIPSGTFAKSLDSCFGILAVSLSQTAGLPAEPSCATPKRGSKGKKAAAAAKKAERETEKDPLCVHDRLLYEARYLVGVVLNLSFRMFNSLCRAKALHLGGRSVIQSLIAGYNRLGTWNARIEFVTQLEGGPLKLQFLDTVLSDHKPISSANTALRRAQLSLDKISGYFLHIEPHVSSEHEGDSTYKAEATECLTLLIAQLLQDYTAVMVEKGERVPAQFVDECERYVTKLSKLRSEKTSGHAGQRVIHSARVISMTAKLMQQICRDNATQQPTESHSDKKLKT